MEYVILECTKTMTFVRAFGEQLQVWTPTEMLRHVDKGVVRETRVCVVPGYAFVPRHNLAELRRRVPRGHPKFWWKVFRYDAMNRPHCVPLSGLREMEEALRPPPSRSASTPEPDVIRHYYPGDCVEVVYHPLFPDGTKGTIVKMRKGGIARIRTAAGFHMEIGKRFLANCQLAEN